MMHEDKIQKMTLRVEFDCYGGTAFIEVNVGMNMLTSPTMLRMHLDESIENFRRKHRPIIANQ